MLATRLQFLSIFGAALAVNRSNAAIPAAEEHAYLTRAADHGDEPELVWHGYPDECFSFTRFADSLAMSRFEVGGYAAAPMVDMRRALVVDFRSATETDAENAVALGWSDPVEFPMGSLSVDASMIGVNAQNHRLERHIAFIATGMRQEAFCEHVLWPLWNRPWYEEDNGPLPVSKSVHGLAYALATLAKQTSDSGVELFSRWRPSTALQRRLEGESVELCHRPLHAIPSEALAANRSYHVWRGTPTQAAEFREAIWAPAWKRKARLG